jgi:dihydroorotase
VLRWAKSRGIAVTAEVTPHHLMLTEELARSYDARYKVNPPLRRESDVRALRAGVAEGVIDIVATDHAPHPIEAKDCEWDAAAFGMVGLESALPVAQATLVAEGHASWAELECLLSSKPAEIGRLTGHPSALAVGEVADLVLIDPRGVTVFSSDRLRGFSTNSPFLGMELPGRVHTTIRRGTVTLDDGVLADPAEVAP